MVGGLARTGVPLGSIHYEFFGPADELLAVAGRAAHRTAARGQDGQSASCDTGEHRRGGRRGHGGARRAGRAGTVDDTTNAAGSEDKARGTRDSAQRHEGEGARRGRYQWAAELGAAFDVRPNAARAGSAAQELTTGRRRAQTPRADGGGATAACTRRAEPHGGTARPSGRRRHARGKGAARKGARRPTSGGTTAGSGVTRAVENAARPRHGTARAHPADAATAGRARRRGRQGAQAAPT